MPPLLRKSTPVLIVERIEPALAFWGRLGLTPTAQVPDEAAGDGRLAFVILAAQGVELMYQTLASVQADLQAAASLKTAMPDGPQKVTLFIEVSDLTDVEARLQGETVFMPRRTTFYGMDETGYVAPCGNIAVFAQPPPLPPDRRGAVRSARAGLRQAAGYDATDLLSTSTAGGASVLA